MENNNNTSSLENYIFDEFGKMGITPTNSEWRLMQSLSQAIEKWICEEIAPKIQTWIIEDYSKYLQDWMIEEYAPGIQEWLIKDYEPAKARFTYWAMKEFPKTFAKILDDEENTVSVNQSTETTEYEEIKD